MITFATALVAVETGAKFGVAFTKKDACMAWQRTLQPIDDHTSVPPFPYDPTALHKLRPDQVPRFYGALTDKRNLEWRDLPLDSLVASQNRVDTGKVKLKLDTDSRGEPLVTRFAGQNYIADGHHDLAADYLAGKTTARVRYYDLEPHSNLLKDKGGDAFTLVIPIQKVDDVPHMVYGWASVSKDGDTVVTDWDGHQIDIGELQKAAHQYVQSSRVGGEGHRTMGVSQTVDSIVFTPDVQKALGIDLGRTGWFIGQKITNPDTWARVKKGDLKAFSIGGRATIIANSPNGPTSRNNLFVNEISLVRQPGNPKADVIYSKGSTTMETDLVTLAKRGSFDAATPEAWFDAVKKRAAAIKKPDETDGGALTRALATDEDAKALFQAERQARRAAVRAPQRGPGETEARQDTLARTTAKLTAAAARIRAERPDLSATQAFEHAKAEHAQDWQDNRAAQRLRAHGPRIAGIDGRK